MCAMLVEIKLKKQLLVGDIYSNIELNLQWTETDTVHSNQQSADHAGVKKVLDLASNYNIFYKLISQYTDTPGK